jgi:hypothetical protein
MQEFNPASPSKFSTSLTAPRPERLINYSTGASLPVTNAQFVGTDRRLVELTTGPQIAGIYTIVSIAATDLGGSAVDPPSTAGEFEWCSRSTIS